MHIGKFDIFPLISVSDIVAMNELTLILEIIAQCDVKHIMTSPLKKITVLKLSGNNITCITARPIGLILILVMFI